MPRLPHVTSAIFPSRPWGDYFAQRVTHSNDGCPSTLCTKRTLRLVRVVRAANSRR
jgi:hypothetical protein